MSESREPQRGVRASRMRRSVYALVAVCVAAPLLVLSSAGGAQTAQATLDSLTLSGIALPGDGFSAEVTEYRVHVPSTLASTTVTATASTGAEVAILPSDAGTADGHQVSLAEGENLVAVMVHNGSSARMYTVTVVKASVVVLTSDAMVSAVAFSGIDDFVFDGSERTHEARFVAGLERTTVTVTAAAGALVQVSPADVDGMAEGHQVDLGPETTEVTVRAESSDGTVTATHTVVLVRPVDRSQSQFSRALAPDNAHPHGLWSDGTHLWVMDRDGQEVHAYDMEYLRPVPELGFEPPHLTFHGMAWDVYDVGPGITGANGKLWLSQSLHDDESAGGKQDPQALPTTVTAESKSAGRGFCFGRYWDIRGAWYYPGNTHTGQERSSGLWTDGDALWIANVGRDDWESVYIGAYRIDYEHPNPWIRRCGGDREIYGIESGRRPALAIHGSGNTDPGGLWSDGVTMWVVDTDDDRVYAYDMGTRRRLEHLEIDSSVLAAAGNEDPWGIWSDGERLWVTDTDDARVYVYGAMPASAWLTSLGLEGIELSEGFSPSVTDYTADVAADVTSTVVSVAGHSAGQVSVSPADADTGTEGHQVSLSAGENVISVVSTAGGRTVTYSVTVNVALPTEGQQEADAPAPQGSTGAEPKSKSGSDPVPVTEPPAKPTGLSTSVMVSVDHDGEMVNEVTLSWDDPGDDTITGYRILRRDTRVDARGVFAVLVENTGDAATTYLDTPDDGGGVLYVYRVIAVNDAGSSKRSNYANLTTPIRPG